MKNIFALLMLAIVMTTVVATDYEPVTESPNAGKLEIIYTGDYSFDVKEKSFYLPFSVKCSEATMCGGKINVDLLITGGLERAGSGSLTCMMTSTSRQCDYNLKFNFIVGSSPSIKIRASDPYGQVTWNDEIKVKWYVGELKGIINVPSKVILYDNFNADVEYTCEKAVCLGVDLTLEHDDGIDVVGGSNVYSCGTMDHTATCKHTFTLQAVKTGTFTISPAAIAFLPMQSSDPEPVKIMVEEMSKVPAQQQITTTGKNIFELFWEWLTGLFK